MFLTSPSDVVAMCPPSASSNVTSSSSKQTVIQYIERSNDDIVLSCGINFFYLIILSNNLFENFILYCIN